MLSERRARGASPAGPGGRRGIALLSVIFIMVSVLILAFTFSFMTVSERRSTGSTYLVNDTIQIADAVSERARQTLVQVYQDNNLTMANYLYALQRQLDGIDVKYPELDGVRTVGDFPGVDARWQVTAVSPDLSTWGWIEVAATAERSGGEQTVIRRVAFGTHNVFELALLSERTDCMYCHLRVNGDVGSLDFLRPGWGSEGGSGSGSGGAEGGSVIHGSVYAAQGVTGDDTNLSGGNKKLNGAKVDGDIEVDSRSPKLPGDLDGDGVPDFPPIDREVAKANALGSIGVNPAASDGARIVKIARGATLTSSAALNTGSPTGISKTFDGQVILVGTAANPIVIDKDVYIDGDVIIKGVVTGTGAIYAGRNIYVAGDVTLASPPDPIGSGVCAGIAATDPGADDLCAEANVKAGKDTLRAAARGSVVIGDYTEYDAAGDVKRWSELQSSDYYRAQFGFDAGDRHYHKGSGDELLLVDGVYKNADGTEIPSTQVVTVAATAREPTFSAADTDAYDYSFRPGTVDAGGGFQGWLSDSLYQELLGTESFEHNTWRTNVGSADRAQIRAQLVAAIHAAGLANLTTGAPLVSRLADGSYRVDDARLAADLDEAADKDSTRLRDADGNAIGQVHWQGGGKIMRVLFAPEGSYETQVNEIDAFLYANGRIAGKTSMQAVAVNGGMIAREIGVLAPGRVLPWWVNGSFKGDFDDDCGDPASAYFVRTSEDCALTINYDYRLRNGGYGFNIIRGFVGRTIGWQLADDVSQRVPR